MGQYVCHHKGQFFIWSTVVDAPTTFGLSRTEFDEYYRFRFGEQYFQSPSYTDQIEEAIRRGVSANDKSLTLEELVAGNRAGFDESRLTLEQIIQIFLIEGRSPVKGEGVERKHDNG